MRGIVGTQGAGFRPRSFWSFEESSLCTWKGGGQTYKRWECVDLGWCCRAQTWGKRRPPLSVPLTPALL